jgi:hypothetical protein
MDDLGQIVGSTVYSSSGYEIGTVSKLYSHFGQPTWAAVTTGKGQSHRLVPLAGASKKGAGVVVPFTKGAVVTSPTMKIASTAQELAGLLSKHYGLEKYGGGFVGGLESMTGGPLPGPPAGGGDRPAPKEGSASKKPAPRQRKPKKAPKKRGHA